MEYRIGQIVPFEQSRGVTGGRLARPRWHALTVRSGKERATCEHLKQKGVHACFPEREKSWVIRGKRHQRKYPVIAGIVYAKFKHEPNWDILKARNLITGVFSYGVTPIALPDAIVRAVMGLPSREEELAQARADLLRVRVGDRAEVASGPLAGAVVDVRKVEKGRVWFETLTGIKGETSLPRLVRKDVD
ncbi:transcription termination/antitermination protein NusG [Roseovarius indicus]|nr:transcription termination/antitermination NusG family protein [Roseovarius indicus]